MTYCRTFVSGALLLSLSACSDDDPVASTNDPNTPGDNCERVVADADCDDSLRPIVFIHGTFGSATEISNPAMLFGSNGYCQDRFVAVEYNSLGGRPLEDLIVLVDEVLARTGFDQVDLAGHSQGTGHACSFLSDPARAAKVAHYMNISGGCAGNGVPTLSLSSQNDLRGGPVHPPASATLTQVTLQDEDHVALAGSKLAFIEMYKFLTGKDPQYTTIQCGQNPVVLDGKSVTFGDNEPRAGSTLDFFEVAKLASSPWERGQPALTTTADADGHFRVELKRNVQYEVRITGSDGTLLGYGYPTPLQRSNYLGRFLTESTNPTVADSTTKRVVRSPNHVGLVARYVAGALRPDWGNSLKIDGEEVLNADNAPRNASRVGLFIYDANENSQSDLGSVFTTSFIGATDVFLDASTPRWMEISWTNEENRSIVMKVPNWPSDRNLASINLPYP